jgi:hypothetical protein
MVTGAEGTLALLAGAVPGKEVIVKERCPKLKGGNN